MIKTSKGWLLFILNTGLTFVLIGLLNVFMTDIEISMQGAFVFALISGFLNWKLSDNGKEPPNADSKEFTEIRNKYRP